MAEVRPIDANALVKSIRDCYCKDCNSYNGVRCRACNFDDAISVIDDAPTLDYAPVRHGEWMIHHYNSETYEYEDIPYNQETFDNPSGTLFCSACDAEALLNAHEEDVPSKHCPNCGAKMDGGAAQCLNTNT